MTIILYTRRNVGMYALSYLVAKEYSVKVISDDANVLWLAGTLGCKIVDFDTMGEYDLFICVHGDKIIDKKYLKPGFMINVHPCLNRYPGVNPIKKYIRNKDTEATVESQWLIEDVDAGVVIHREEFNTPPITSYEGFYNIAMPYYWKVLDGTMSKILNK